MENNENNNIVQTHSCKKECLWVALLTFAGSFLAFYLLAHQTYLHYFSPMKNKISKMEENIAQDFSKMEKEAMDFKGLSKRELNRLKNKISAIQSAKYEDAYVIVIDLKQFGNNEENIRFSLNGNVATISGTSKKSKHNSENEYYFTESFAIPEKIKINAITKEKINNKYIITLPIEDD